MPSLTDRFLGLLQSSTHHVHLDIGCSNGAKTINFARAGLPTIGLDQSEPALLEARRLVERHRLTGTCRFVLGSCFDLPFEAGAIQSASDIMCFTHIPRSQWWRYERGIAAALPSGGHLLMVLFSDKDTHFHGHPVSSEYVFRFDRYEPLMAEYMHYDGMHNVHFDERSVHELFSSTFDVVEAVEVPHPVDDHRHLWNVILARR
jgi:cyclopropane fatty-acyl-phospholipid synthase-like methyltransferase